MKVDSFWRCTGSAGVYPFVESGKDTADEKAFFVSLCKFSELYVLKTVDFIGAGHP